MEHDSSKFVKYKKPVSPLKTISLAPFISFVQNRLKSGKMQPILPKESGMSMNVNDVQASSSSIWRKKRLAPSIARRFCEKCNMLFLSKVHLSHHIAECHYVKIKKEKETKTYQNTSMQHMSNSNEAPFNPKQAVINQYLIFQNSIQNMNTKYDYNLGRNMQIYNSAQEQHLNNVYKSDDLNQQKQQMTLCHSYSQSSVGNRNSSSSLESFDTIQSKLSPYKSPLPENISNRRDSGSWSFDCISYSGNNSVENPFLTVVASKRYDSYSVSHSDSYPSINGSPVKLDPHLTQIPEVWQPADDELVKKLKLVTEDSNGRTDHLIKAICLEKDCPNKIFNTTVELRDHLAKEHEFIFHIVRNKMKNEEEFQKWKKDVEEVCKIIFCKESTICKKSTINRSSNTWITTYTCHKNIIHYSTDKISNKQHHYCTASLKVIKFNEPKENGHIYEVELYPDHYGHNDLSEEVKYQDTACNIPISFPKCEVLLKRLPENVIRKYTNKATEKKYFDPDVMKNKVIDDPPMKKEILDIDILDIDTIKKEIIDSPMNKEDTCNSEIRDSVVYNSSIKDITFQEKIKEELDFYNYLVKEDVIIEDEVEICCEDEFSKLLT